jgi:futalosine hydrolase
MSSPVEKEAAKKSKTLVLVPTGMELRHLQDFGGFPLELTDSAICGFGVIAAAARCASLLAELKPSRVLLVGIAGTYDPHAAPVGAALEFSRVAIDGIGAGQGRDFIGSKLLGFPQWPGSDEIAGEPIFDDLELSAPRSIRGLLLTVCAASIDAAEAATRKERFATARAEDMEGFAVAMACVLRRCPLRIVRGISNVAGHRVVRDWKISEALQAAHRLAMEIIESGGR